MKWKQRTVNCGELRPGNDGKLVILNGWIHSRRDLGGMIFFDIRDRWGITQIVFEPEINAALAEKAKSLRSEFVLWIEGTVRLRENPNPNIPTGLIEIAVGEFGVINKAKLPPFDIADNIDTSEEIKLTHRFLDLRRHSLQKNFIIRNQACQTVHKYFADNDFLEIETPVLMKSTPEGARDFLVPSRINKGKFYALPQSPQIFKQILMIAGFEKYVQIVKCFRDEDLRSDRQPEFTQIDIEMSFVERKDVLSMAEGLMKQLWKDVLGVEIETPFARMSFRDAMTRYGSDKPDLRFGLELASLSDIVADTEFKVFSAVVKSGGEVAALNAKGCADYSRKQIDNLTEFAKKYGAKGLAWIKVKADGIQSPIAKFLSEDELDSIIDATNAKEGDLILISSDKWMRCYTILGALRLEIARQTGIMDRVKGQFSFHWVVDFPLFEKDEETGEFNAMHHPFTTPNDEDIDKLDTAPDKAYARAYDLVVNGAELGGGSIRIHDSNIQRKMFELLGMSAEEADAKFGFLLEALKYGAPPHGGIALGLDRIVMTLAGTANIRDVIAFPKTTSGLSLMDGSPSEVDIEQLKELGLDLLKR